MFNVKNKTLVYRFSLVLTLVIFVLSNHNTVYAEEYDLGGSIDHSGYDFGGSVDNSGYDLGGSIDNSGYNFGGSIDNSGYSIYPSYGGSINYGGYSGYSSAYSYGTNGPSYTPRWNPNVGNWSASYQTNYAPNAPVPNTPAFVNGNGGEVDMSGWNTDYRLTYGTNTSTDYRVTCFVEDTTVRRGEDVEFSARAIGGSGDYEYEWFGDDDIDGSRDEFEHDFDYDGVYRVSVEVTDADGYTTSDDCDPIYVGQNYYGVNYVQDYGSPEGELANTSSVYLSQVPYTGAKDTAKMIGLVAFAAVWSIALGYYFLKRRSVKAVSNRIADFKKANLAARA